MSKKLHEEEMERLHNHYRAYPGDIEVTIDNDAKGITITDKDKARKAIMVYQILEFFPDAILEVGKVIAAGQSQHIKDGGKPKWDKTISNDHLGSLMRHLIDDAKGERVDVDNTLHLAKVVWRGLAEIQTRIENDG